MWLVDTSLSKGRVGLIDTETDSTASRKSLSKGRVGLTKDDIGLITSGSLYERRVGSTKYEIGLTTWSTKGWVYFWETIGCSQEGNSWVSNHTLCTSTIAGHWWVRWSPSHRLQGNLSFHFARLVFSTVSTWLVMADCFLSVWPTEDESFPPTWPPEAGWLGPTWLREAGCWKNSRCSKKGWPWNQTLRTPMIAGNWWVIWSPSHRLQGNLSFHFERPFFSMVSTLLVK